jgi:hypothetical protein
MKYSHRDAAAIDDIANDVEAMQSLAGGISAGLHQGMVDPAHIHRLFATHATAIHSRLAALAHEMRERVASNDCDQADAGD